MLDLETENIKCTEPVLIKISNYENLRSVLSQVVIPFSECIKKSDSPDIYNGQEKIAFKKRYPAFQDIMCGEFEREMVEYQVAQIKELIL